MNDILKRLRETQAAIRANEGGNSRLLNDVADEIECLQTIVDEQEDFIRRIASTVVIAAGNLTRNVEQWTHDAARYENLLDEIEQLQVEVQIHRDKARGDYWAWQGDEEDHLELLVCPVLIHPSDLRKIMEAAEAAGGEK